MKLLLMTILLCPLVSFADTEVKITSFIMTNNNNINSTTAEICGTLIDTEKKQDKVIILSDPGKREGRYVAHVTPQGRFCHIIRTTTLTAQIQAYDQDPNKFRSKVFHVNAQ